MFSIAKILLPVDFSERASQAARFAVPVAERFQSKIILLHVLSPYFELGAAEMGGPLLMDVRAERLQEARQRMAGFLSEELGFLSVQRLLMEGDPAREIVECAHREGAGLIMMPTHGYGPFRRLLLGSVTAKVLHDADCPVWTTAHAETPPVVADAPKHILCAIEKGPTGARALAWCAGLAAEFGAQLTLVHPVAELDPRTEGYHFSPEWRKFLMDSAEAEIAKMQASAGTHVEVALTIGPAAEMVCEEARKVEADLLVIGRGADAGILGRLTGQAYAMIRQAPCPVVSV